MLRFAIFLLEILLQIAIQQYRDAREENGYSFDLFICGVIDEFTPTTY